MVEYYYNEGGRYLRFMNLEENDVLEVFDVPKCHYKTAQRFSKISIRYDKREIDFYHREDIGTGLVRKAYRAYKCDDEVIVDYNGAPMRFKVKHFMVVPDNSMITAEIVFCLWLYRAIFKSGDLLD